MITDTNLTSSLPMNFTLQCCPKCKCEKAQGYAGQSWKKYFKESANIYKIFRKEKLKVTYTLDTQYSYNSNQDPAWSNPPANCSHLGIYQWKGIWAWANVCYSVQSYSPPELNNTWGVNPQDNLTWNNIVGGSWSDDFNQVNFPPNDCDFSQLMGFRHNFNNVNFPFNYLSEMQNTPNIQDQMDAAAAAYQGAMTSPLNDSTFKNLVFAQVNIAGMSATWSSGPINYDTELGVQDTYPVNSSSLPQGQHDFWHTDAGSNPNQFRWFLDISMGPPSPCYFCCDIVIEANDEVNLDSLLDELI
jgi:hypothetical protein